MLPIWRDNWLFLLLDGKNSRERDVPERVLVEPIVPPDKTLRFVLPSPLEGRVDEFLDEKLPLDILFFVKEQASTSFDLLNDLIF